MTESLLLRANLSHSYENDVADELISIARVGTYVFAVVDDTADNGNTLGTELVSLTSAYKNRAVFAGRIAGHDYTEGRVKSINTGSNNLNGDAEITVVIEEKIKNETAPVQNYFFDLVPKPHLLNGISESETYDRSGSNLTYTRNVSFSYNQDANISDFKTDIIQFVSDYKAKREKLSSKIDGITDFFAADDTTDSDYTEVIDEKSLSYSLTETVTLGEVNGSYTLVQKETETVDRDGYKNKSVQATITSLKNARNTNLQNSMKLVVAKIISESSSYAVVPPAKPISSTRGFNVDSKQASVTLVFSNRPEDRTGDVVNYSVSEIESNNIKAYTLNINFRNADGLTKAAKWTNTKSLYSSKQSTLLTYIQNLFGQSAAATEVSKTADFNRSENKITQNVSFTTDNIYPAGLPDGILSESFSSRTDNIETNGDEHRYNIEFDLASKKDFLMTNLLGKILTASGTVTVKFSDKARSSIIGHMDGLATKIEAELDKVSPVQMDYNVESDTVTIDYSGNSATRTITYKNRT
jgi:hypothetical protein